MMTLTNGLKLYKQNMTVSVGLLVLAFTDYLLSGISKFRLSFFKPEVYLA